jgi:hypothetical protein
VSASSAIEQTVAGRRSITVMRPAAPSGDRRWGSR